MMTVTRDPMTLNDVANLATAPWIIEGKGDNEMKIYFESEESKQEYLAMEMHGSCNSSGLKQIFDDISDCPITGSIN
jgi:hypothetical protein